MRSEAAPRYGALIVLWSLILGAIALACAPVALTLVMIWSAR